MLVKSKIKYIQSLGQKKFRDAERLFIAEGPKVVKELLEAGSANIEQVYAVKEWITENKKWLGKTKVIEITATELEKISQLTTTNKVVALVKQFDIDAKIITKGKITLALDTIQDPGNLGTIIRIADWFAVEQIVCNHSCADAYNPKVVQATMGSIARVKIFYTGLDEWLAAPDVRIYATTLEGQDVTAMKKIQEGIILIGNESKGITPGILNLANTRITIPQKGKAESLNAAVATGIILSHIS
jgi:TrmH family RNA methyltransferase